jgi:hypothetical protein
LGFDDARAKPSVFPSQDERDRWQVRQYGAVRNGFREYDEPTDDRPLRIDRCPFWEPGEDVIWVRAVRACPLREYGSLDVFRYLGEVAKLAQSMDTAPKLRAMPKRGMA